MEETKKAGNAAQHRDIRAKDIFDNPELCAQFLRDYAVHFHPVVPYADHVAQQLHGHVVIHIAFVLNQCHHIDLRRFSPGTRICQPDPFYVIRI